MSHICLPRLCPIFNVDQWQCGCGKYFCKEEAQKQILLWLKENHLELSKENNNETQKKSK